MSKGLYRPEEFRDNCGFGLIAHLKGDASHRLLSTAIESLTCMTHRGGIAPDGKTGDGCGLLFSKPDNFLRTVAKDDVGITLPENYAVAKYADDLGVVEPVPLADHQLRLLLIFLTHDD